jgi:glucose/arabinose dehydrogenase
MRSLIFPALLLTGLSACGGDDGPSSGGVTLPTPTPSAPNSPPAFTSAATATILENKAEAHQALVSDANGDPISLSISGGADAALFTLDSATGRLSFRAPPNFDEPGDANGDNVYDVRLTASDGQASTAQDVQISVTNSREGIAVRRVATGFSQPIQVYKVTGDDSRIYVIEKGGSVYELFTVTGQRTLLFTVADLSTINERGLLGITTGPTNASGGFSFYVLATLTDGTVQIRQYTPTGSSPVVYTPQVLLSVPHPGASNHNGGWINFGPDGQLYAGIGDGGGSGDANNNAQNPNLGLGKIVRLALSPGWVASPQNSFASGGGDPYVFALGLRNPFRASFEGDKLIIGDVGENKLEEINIISTASAGANLGWHLREGTDPFTGTTIPGLIDPVLQYGHGSGPLEGASVIGGLVYHGPVTSLKGSYVFADFVSHHIWSIAFAKLIPGQTLDRKGFELRDADFKPDVGTINQPVNIGSDDAENLFIVDLDGEIFQVMTDPTSS